ncbi:lysylphosphatidylglycerol synthase transmembrane domain-containing protein [Winogradskyella aurantiaca]|uniref:lysylphosphatidylglycerol synthase transmembrane domain-containing protein n=1 Tax=Winogradskyella aurantiaca TaxID=2219558 RepID=UPI000E1E2402|nr:lysylphosphatidylglycerol synthase transmembrane domain-containing protein [Winogradskyella aurantiaca]
MSKTAKTILKIGLPLTLGLVLVWYSLNKISVQELYNYAKGANYWYIALGVTFGILSHASRAYRWLYMAQPLGFKPKFANSFMAVYAAYLINMTVPRAGEIARASILANYEDVPFEKGFGTIVSERVADTLMLLLVIGLAMVYQYDFLMDFFNSKFQTSTLVTLLVLGLAFGSLVILFVLKSKGSIATKIRNFLTGLLEGVLSIFKMKNKWYFIAHTIFIWVMYVLMFYVTTLSLSEFSAIPFGAVLVGFILASFSIAATNGGIGSFPEAVVIAFTLFNLPEDPSRAFGWIMWSAQTLAIIILGGLSLIYLPIYNRKLKEV